MEDDYMSDEDYVRLEHYIEIGAIEVEGVDENGEIIFSITDRAKDIAPELWQAHSDYVDRSLVQLYEAELIEVEYDENLEATIKIKPEGYEKAKEMGLVELFENKESEE